jgi:Domain of unknown function (DUF4304)
MANDVLNRLVRDSLDPPLKSAGFSRKARVWNRPRANLVHVVDCQASRWNQPDSVNFTVNLGVFSPSVYQTCWQKEAPRFVNEVDCQVRRRLSGGSSDLSSATRKEQWWNVGSDAQVVGVGKEVADLLQSKAVPFLDRFESLADVLSVLEKDAASHAETPLARIYMAAIKAELGDLDAARAALNAVLATAPNAWRARAAAVAEVLSRKSTN